MPLGDACERSCLGSLEELGTAVGAGACLYELTPNGEDDRCILRSGSRAIGARIPLLGTDIRR